jgi:hypothetical protein
MRRRIAISVSIAALAAAPAAGVASNRSLDRGPGPRPGPALLYAKPFKSPQLSNAKPWHAKPILVSGSTAYRNGEFLYQDFLYDDNGARETADPNDPRAAGNVFSKPNGTYTYPTDRRYASNAADLVEVRVKPIHRGTAFRVSLNTMKAPKLVAFSIAIGGKARHKFEFPYGANVRTPASLFLTVHPKGSRMAADLRHAATGKLVSGPAPRVKVDKRRRQIQVRVPHRDWNPRRRTVRLAAGVGLWDRKAGRYLLPGESADATTSGGAGSASKPAAFFNVAFRLHEPVQSPTEGLSVITNAAWWRDRQQGTALAAGDISSLFAKVSFRKLRKHVRDDSRVPKRGPFDRIYASHFEVGQGADFSQSCLAASADCPGQYQSRLQPYAIYVPRKKHRPAHGWGMTLLLHSLSASYNQYLGSRNQRQFGERGGGSIVITPLSRGPDENYENYGAADVFDVWADVAHRYRLDPGWTAITGYSMGGVGTFKLGSQFPDLFARAQPTVGFESNSAVLASMRNLPVHMWNNHGDELVNEGLYNATAAQLDSDGYRYEVDRFQPCANPACSPLFPNHLQLAINDQYAPMAKFLGRARVPRNPRQVTYVLDAARNHANLRLVGDHAYWVSHIKPRDPSQNGAGTDPGGKIDVVSHGFGGGVTPSPTTPGAGTLTGGNLGTIAFDSQKKTWNPAVGVLPRNRLVVTATNVASATIDVKRAHVTCKAGVAITSDGPIKIALRGCHRTVSGG